MNDGPLEQLRNGNWIRLGDVTQIRAEKGWIVGNKDEPASVVVQLADPRARERIELESFDEARRYRDQLADRVNRRSPARDAGGHATGRPDECPAIDAPACSAPIARVADYPYADVNPYTDVNPYGHMIDRSKGPLRLDGRSIDEPGWTGPAPNPTPPAADERADMERFFFGK